MSLRTRIAGWLTGKSLGAGAAAWLRGDDLVDRPSARLVSGYNQSGWVHAAVNLVSGEFTGLPLDFYAQGEEFDDAALAAWWAAPALGADGKPMPRSTVDRLCALHLLLDGEFFLLLDESWLLPTLRSSQSEARARFIVAPPARVRLLVQSGVLQGYEFIDSAGRRSVYLPEQVIHRMEPNPLDEWRGLGRAQVAKVATEGAFLTGVYIRELMRNNGDQGFLVIAKSGVVDDPQREQIAAALRAKRAALRAGVAKDVLLTGDITVDRAEEQAAGADLTATLAMSQQEIFVTFGVPPSLATVKQSYSVGKESDRYQLITATSQPLARLIASAYAEAASRQTGQPLTAEHCWEDHPVLQEVRRSRIDAGLKLWATGMAWADINDFLDLGMAEFPGWDVAYLPFSVSPVSPGETALSLSKGDPVTDPALAEPQDPQLQSLRLLLLARQRASAPRECKTVTPTAPDEFAAFACACSGSVSQLSTFNSQLAARALRDAKQVAHWKSHMAKRRGTVASFKSAFSRVLMQARVETLKKIEAQHIDPSSLKGVATKNVALDFLFDAAKFAIGYRSAMENQHKAAIKTAGQQLFEEVGKLDPFSAPPEAVLQFLAQRENKLKDVPDAVFERIKATLEAGLKAGETTAQLSARVKSEFNAIGDLEAKRIALTETAAAYGFARSESMKQAGIQFKAWLTSGNDNVRDAHLIAGSEYPAERGIPVDEPFIVDGEELMYPGDSAGSARNVINCHCVSIPVRSPEEEQPAAAAVALAPAARAAAPAALPLQKIALDISVGPKVTDPVARTFDIQRNDRGEITRVTEVLPAAPSQ